MRKKAAITSGVAAAVLGGGLVLALNGGGSASAERTAATQAQPRAAASASPSATKIDRAAAEQIALTMVPGGTVRSAELETEHGVLVWSVRVSASGTTHDLDIDARTGTVLRDQRDGAAAPRPSRTPEAQHRHGEAEQRHDHAREAEHRHGADDGADDHGRHGEGADDHGRHGEGEDHHGGGGGHRGRG